MLDQDWQRARLYLEVEELDVIGLRDSASDITPRHPAASTTLLTMCSDPILETRSEHRWDSGPRLGRFNGCGINFPGQ